MLLLDGALEKLLMAKHERIKRLQILIEKLPSGSLASYSCEAGTSSGCEPHVLIDQACVVFLQQRPDAGLKHLRERFLAAIKQHVGTHCSDYIGTMQALSPDAREDAYLWLSSLVGACEGRIAELLPGLRLFRKTGGHTTNA